MKNINFIILGSLLLLISCSDAFLDRLPQTSVTEEKFFNNAADLETYTNGFYSMIGPASNDVYSDNISTNTTGSEADDVIRGSISSANVGGWDSWSDIRRINFMLERVYKTTGDAQSINHYVGIAKFFRGMLYYNMVKRYNDVPWYSSTLTTSDDDLYKKQDARTVVVDSVFNDLRYAARHIKAAGSNSRLTKWAALTLLARTALHEGTFRKYHTDLNLKSTAQAYLELADSASSEIINNGGFAIHNTGKGELDFRALFTSNNLDGNKEVIFVRKNDRSLGVGNNTHAVLDWQWALTRNLVEEYLMKDGSRFTDLPNHDKKQFAEIFKGRDPRLAETVMPPGFATDPGGASYVIKPSFGGYLQVKFYPRDPALRGGWDLNYTDLAIFRYAEVLLIKAEAAAELGRITQAELNQTIGALRARVHMPVLDLAKANSDIDPRLAQQYPLIEGANRGVLLEIRRERRVETACEGLRYDDLMRWKAGKLLETDGEGIYFPALGGMDVTGDGTPDIALLEAPGKEQPLQSIPADLREKIVKYYLSDGTIVLSNATSGHIQFVKDKQQKRTFLEPQYYYRPIPQHQLVLNPNLVQTPGWK